MPFDIEHEIAKIAEAYCIQNNLTVNRRFTDEELEETFELLADSSGLAAHIEQQAREEYGL